MRALLIVNPHATSTSERRRDLLAHALAGVVSLRVAHTASRGHAAHLAAAAADSGVDLVVVHGGDGTVNEVVNGLMYRGVRPDVPLLGVVPGGSTNVFARALGLSNDPTVATEQILEGLSAGRSQRVGLGRVNDRYFTFNAGLGLDAETVREVERHRGTGRRISNLLHVRMLLRRYLATDRRHPRLTLQIPDGPTVEGAFLVFASNVDPWTYLGSRPIRTNPETSAEGGLGLFAVTGLGPLTTAAVSAQLLRGSLRPHSRHVFRADDTPGATVVADRPVDLQVDGDHLGQRTEVTFTAIPRAVRIVL